jgi:hypothetical protein
MVVADRGAIAAEGVRAIVFELSIVGGTLPADGHKALEQIDQLEHLAAHHGGHCTGQWTFRFATQEAATRMAREVPELGIAHGSIKIRPVESE